MINAPKVEMGVQQASQQKAQLQPRQAKAKPGKATRPEAQPSEPEMIVIPLEEMEQKPQAQQKTKRS